MATNRLTPKSRNLAHVLLGASILVGAGTLAAPAALAEAPGQSPLSAPPAEVVKTAKSPLELQAERLPKVTAAKVLDIAASQIGVSENAQGGGTKFQSWYVSSPRAQETVARDGGNPQAYANASWCAMFVSWVGDQAGIRPTVGWDAYTVTYAQWFKNNGHWGTVAKPGAVVFYDWQGGKSIDGIDHVGFVKKDNGDGTISTIEGNTGNGKVEARVRPTSQVVGYGYPVYSG
ncbi:CHAP domain-containing protein [Streptosporangium sp. NBC_01756]|uniref:CHAP domain-containing protein n=1 Tax=Streptosporangium sp. NBC_01756 TaxID=2975950 RepID=UPI002DDAA967|nr:CHAP domain-containing protein [Streptosporangium sp. NBC_01756]WSC85574.1 CHAP domain-containing protein [Streptosporangium sp. NBC_01756]